MANRESLSAGMAAVLDRARALAADDERDLVESFTTKFLGEIDDDELAARADDIAETKIGRAHV